MLFVGSANCEAGYPAPRPKVPSHFQTGLGLGLTIEPQQPRAELRKRGLVSLPPNFAGQAQAMGPVRSGATTVSTS